MSSYKKGKKKGKAKDRAFLALLLGLTLVLIFAFIYLGYALGFSGQKGSNEAPLPADQAFIQEMVPGSQALQEEYGVLPSIMISQAILESDWGESDLAKQENNYFWPERLPGWGLLHDQGIQRPVGRPKRAF